MLVILLVLPLAGASKKHGDVHQDCSDADDDGFCDAKRVKHGAGLSEDSDNDGIPGTVCADDNDRVPMVKESVDERI